jgi:uncharacterized protein (TIGR02118 family)
MKAIILLHKRADISADEFNQHWREVHRPLLMKMPGLQGLVLNFIPPDPNGSPLCDGVVEAWWDNAEAMQASFGSPEGQAASADAPTFTDPTRTQMLIVEDDVVIPRS